MVASLFSNCKTEYFFNKSSFYTSVSRLGNGPVVERVAEWETYYVDRFQKVVYFLDGGQQCLT